jgi:predicted  nucleic acid-binding Zn-ribbon protein
VSEDRGADLPAPEASGQEAALAELLRAATLAAAALTGSPAQDDVIAFACIVLIDKALGQLTSLLGTVPHLVELAGAGGQVHEQLARYKADLTRQQAEVAAARTELETLRDLEQEVADTKTERDQLRGRIDELEHAQQIAAELPALRSRLRELEAATADIDVAEAGAVTVSLIRAAGHLHAITERQRAMLGEQNSRFIADAEAAAKALEEDQASKDEAEAELAARSKEAEQVTAELKQGRARLGAWRQADADLADRLSAAGFPPGASALPRIHAELSAIEKRLSDLDDELRPAFAEHARAYQEARSIRR